MADILSKSQKTKCKACLACAGEARTQFELLAAVGVDVDDRIKQVEDLERGTTLLLEAQAGIEGKGS